MPPTLQRQSFIHETMIEVHSTSFLHEQHSKRKRRRAGWGQHEVFIVANARKELFGHWPIPQKFGAPWLARHGNCLGAFCALARFSPMRTGLTSEKNSP
jgi:hypothetical protein